MMPAFAQAAASMHRDGTTDATFAAINSDFYNNVRSKK
jgi:hypothetical protein